VYGTTFITRAGMSHGRGDGREEVEREYGMCDKWKPVSSSRELGERRDRKSAMTVRVRTKASRASSIGGRV
jgi:hypothetical protein